MTVLEPSQIESKPHIIILGAGPAGLGAASQLARRTQAQVTVLEQNIHVGGNAGSFELSGVHVDFGSHRLHPTTDPQVLNDIRSLLGEDLLDRPRHGRIRLRGRWIHFPLKPMDLMLRLPPNFITGVMGDIAGKVVLRGRSTGQNETFASLMEKGLGKTICQDFYFPYARKIWGVEPQELSVTQARRRVKNNSLGKMIQKALSAIPGLKPKGSGRFFYPRKGFGQISQVYFQDALHHGAHFELGARVKAVDLLPGEPPAVRFEKDNQLQTLQADYVWSTIPITILARMLNPAPPAKLLEAAQNIHYRAMILVYLVLDTPQFTEYDAHYFPGADIAITRLSEPKNYSTSQEPLDRTVLCAELPCTADGKEWQMTDEDLGKLVCEALARAGLPVKVDVLQSVSRRLRFAYPIYHQGYEQYFERLDEWVGMQENVLTFGRQGLFAHDNTHHALYMAYSAVSCLQKDGSFNQEQWEAYRKIFETHVVED